MPDDSVLQSHRCDGTTAGRCPLPCTNIIIRCHFRSPAPVRALVHNNSAECIAQHSNVKTWRQSRCSEARGGANDMNNGWGSATRLWTVALPSEEGPWARMHHAILAQVEQTASRLPVPRHHRPPAPRAHQGEVPALPPKTPSQDDHPLIRKVQSPTDATRGH